MFDRKLPAILAHMKIDYTLSRLRWACRRGMLELDLIFEKYLTTGYASASADEQALFVKLLEETDQDLFDWLLKKNKPRLPQFAPMIEILLA